MVASAARRKAAREAQEKAYTGKPDPGLVNGRLLSGIARCPRCGGPMGVVKGRADKFYRCSNRARHKVTKPDGTRGTRVCDQPAIRIADVDAAVYAGLEEWQANPDALARIEAAQVAEYRKAVEAQPDQRPRMEREAANLEREIKRLVNALASGDSPDIAAGIAERRVKVESLKSKLAEPVEPPKIDPAALSGLLGPLLPGMPRNDAETRRALRILGLDRLTPERRPDGAVEVKGTADFSGLCGVQKGAGGAASLPSTSNVRRAGPAASRPARTGRGPRRPSSRARDRPRGSLPESGPTPPRRS